MRKIVASHFITFDGVVEAPQEWNGPYFDDDMGAAVGAQWEAADAILIGRRTYEEFAAAWPEESHAEDGGAAFMNGTPKHVVSGTLRDPRWRNSHVIGTADIPALKKAEGRDILVMGSVTLVAHLLAEGLLDELNLLVHPLVAGSGRRLLPTAGPRVALDLVSCTRFDSGVLHLVYRTA